MNDFTPDEISKLRDLLLKEERTTWALSKLKILVPAVVAVVVAIWQLSDWILRHVRVQ